MAKYTEVFEREVLKAYHTLRTEGGVEVNGVLIGNVRDLVKYFGISSYTLYKWNEKTIDDSFETTCEDMQNGLEESEEDLFEEVMTSTRTEAKEDFFNGRYYAWMGARLNIPYASRNAKETNMLKIGLELIKRSGLVSNGVVKELRQ